ncbi:MAG: hypothetical protein PHE78_02000 [Candidatus Gastranaerophilales bacterium]|nr:hypothetical protein [Candidatus Gastranaerophilales bacterium]
MLNSFDLDIEQITKELHNITIDAQKTALEEIEETEKFPQITKVFQDVCNSVK